MKAASQEWCPERYATIGIPMIPPRHPPVFTMLLIVMVSPRPTVMVAPQNEPSVSSKQPKHRVNAATAAYGFTSRIVIRSNNAAVMSPARGTIRNPHAMPNCLQRRAASAPPLAAPAAAASGGATASQPLSPQGLAPAEIGLLTSPNLVNSGRNSPATASIIGTGAKLRRITAPSRRRASMTMVNDAFASNDISDMVVLRELKSATQAAVVRSGLAIIARPREGGLLGLRTPGGLADGRCTHLLSALATYPPGTCSRIGCRAPAGAAGSPSERTGRCSCRAAYSRP
jgi:hypothetical protein